MIQMKQGGRRINGNHKQEIKDIPVVSVITAVYNGEIHLEKTINSVINQTYSNIEYIIIDGNSSDNTVDIIKKYEKEIDYWISEPDSGIYEAFNKGLSYASGDYIGFINSGDWYESDGIQKIMADVKKDPAIYCGHMNLISENGDKPATVHKSNPERLFQTMRVAHPASFVSRHIFNQIGGFSTTYKIAGDYDFMLRARLKGFYIFVVDKIVTNMPLGGISKDLMTVYREERIIKNLNLGRKLRHWIWYASNVLLYLGISFINKFKK